MCTIMMVAMRLYNKELVGVRQGLSKPRLASVMATPPVSQNTASISFVDPLASHSSLNNTDQFTSYIPIPEFISKDN